MNMKGNTNITSGQTGEAKDAFFPLAFRMKYIGRWGLMRGTEPENLLEHSAECAMLAHALARIGNDVFGKNYDAGAVAVGALYHDISEIYTGDLPTPIKYHNNAISESYKQIEREACERLLFKLPDSLQAAYRDALEHDGASEEAVLIKAADKLCALIKCVQERRFGNREFDEAYETILASVEKLAARCEELAYFVANFLPGFDKSLDEL